MAERKADLLSAHAREEIDKALARYPADKKKSAVLSALHVVQHENGGHLTTELMAAVADYLELPEIAVFEVGTFYSMFELQPVGRHSVSVCRNISCMLRGADDLIEHIEKKYGVTLGETTEDGRFYLKCEEECLAACRNAPMAMVDHVYYENLTPERLDEILDGLE